MLSRRSGPRNSRRHHRDRPRQVHLPSPVLQRNNRPALPRNRALQLNSRLPACRQARRECHPLVRLALLLRELLHQEQRLLRR